MPHVRQLRVLGAGDFLVGAVVFILSFAVYLRTLAPVVYGEDSGELVAAAYTLGIPHPTGYPLWCILANLFINLVPIGNIAWRANLLSAVFGAGAATIAALIICVVVRHRVAALAGALAFAFSLEMWEQSVIAEVYSLNAFITALCTLLLMLWSKTRRNRYLYAGGLAFGVGLTNHQVLLLAAPAFAVYVLAVGGVRRSVWTTYLLTLLLAFFGLVVYLYLPIRSAANPAMDWGDPETWSNFVDVVTREQYQFIITESPRSWARFWQQCRTFGSIYLDQFTIGLGLFAPFGLVVVWRRAGRAATVMFALAWLSNALGSILIPNYGDDRMSIWLNTTYWIPAYLVAAILLGAAIAGVCAATPRLGIRTVVAAGLCFVAVVAPLLAHYSRNDKSRYFLADDYARNVLATMKPGAIYFGDTDLALFPAMYCQIVEGLRNDVTIANPYGYPTENVFAAMPDMLKNTVAKRPTVEDEQVIFEWLVKHSGRPVYSTSRRSGEGIHSVSEGLLYRYAPLDMPLHSESPWDRYHWHSVDEAAFEDDWSAEVILFEYYFARGRADLDAGRRASGIHSFERAAHIARANKEALNNLGCAAGNYTLLDSAAEYFRAALALDPQFDMARLNLGRVHLKRGDFKQAKAEFDTVLDRDPNNSAARTLSEYCAAQLGDQ